MPKYSTNRTPSRLYRNIYTKHHGSIPVDESGRTYEIHHIDGDHTNNDISNLVAVSMQEHYDIHYSQGDYGCCILMAFKMNMPDKEMSDLMKASHKKRKDNGTHITQQKWICEHCNTEGVNLLNYYNSHGDSCPKNPNIDIDIIEKKKKTSKLMSKSQKTAQRKSVSDGTHNSQVKWHCIHCGMNGMGSGNYRWHGDNCLKNPNVSLDELNFRKIKSNNSPMKNKEISKKFRDPNYYDFEHKETGEVKRMMTRSEFMDLYNCKSFQVTRIVKDRSKSLYGWKVIGQQKSLTNETFG